jgi:non-reducing end alpha-L-arabinofuranosidase
LPFAPPLRQVQQGAIILGIGGDNSDWAISVWLEGCMATGVTSNATDAALAANIAAAGIGK